MDRRTLLFIAVSIAIIVAYQELVLKRLAPHGPGGSPEQVAADRSAEPAGPSPAPIPSIERAELPAPSEGEREEMPQGRRISIETDLYTAVLNTAGGRIESFTLKKFRSDNTPASPPLDLIVPGADSESPMGLELRGARSWSDTRSVYESATGDTVSIAGGDQSVVELRTTVGDQPLLKRLTFRAGEYPIDLRVETPAAESLARELTEPGPNGEAPGVALVWSKTLSHEKQASRVFVGAAAVIDGKLIQKGASSLDKPENLTGDVAWAGYEDHYFLSAVAPERATLVALRPHGDAVETKIVTQRQGSGPLAVDYTLFLGPKETSALEGAGHDLQRSLNLGWFGPISLFLLWVLNLSHRITGNYGIDIIVLTILVKIAFWPLTKKSFLSMREMQKLQPEMAKLREKFKDDPKQMNTEVMELYKRHKVNPLGGCLPMVLQIPVFFGLYQALSSAIQLRHAPFFAWITDLSAPERLQILGYGIPVLTLLLGASMFVQQKMAPPAGDPTQQKVMMFMPIIFTYMFIGFPAGLTIYWLTNNVLTIAQQYVIMRVAPAPKPARA
jgi:YidC/Oxa1 family membrane protein insertase